MDDALIVERPFSNTKLDDAMSHLSKFKAPGWDRLTMEFIILYGKSALLYAIATHPLLKYLDYLKQSGHMTGLKLPGAEPFLAQAYADDSFFMPQNSPQELCLLMDSLSAYALAAGLHVNFDKSKLIPLKHCDWHMLLRLGQILNSKDIVRHLPLVGT